VNWALIMLLYLGLWWAIILLVNSVRITAETAALALVSAWALLVLVLPALITAAAQILYPPPSRYEQIGASRAAEIAATKAWDNDHKQAPDGDVAGALADLGRSLAINASIEAAVSPVSRQFDAQLLQQQRLIGALSFLSPARVAADAMAASAGTGSDAAIAFRQSISAYLAALKQPIATMAAEGQALTLASYGSLPRYTPPAPSPVPLPALLYLAAGLLLVAVLAARRFASLRLD
jgi:ABC-2 type transport system permease protein